MTLALAELYTTPEILRLMARLLFRRAPPAAFILGWSRWRRRHQATAARAHQAKRLNQQL